MFKNNDKDFFTAEDLYNGDLLGEKDKRDWMYKINDFNKRKYDKENNHFFTSQTSFIHHEVLLPKIFEKKPDINVDEEMRDVSFYLQQIKSVRFIEELPKVLPIRKQEKFEEIINAILLSLLNEKLEIDKFILTEQVLVEDLEELNREKDWLSSLINQIINYRDQKEKRIQVIKKEEENLLLFLTTLKGNYYVLKDLKDIDPEYYDLFLELMNSIQNGTFKNVKSLANNDLLKEMYEVKNGNTRIFFHRINFSIFVILGLFVKKVDIDSYYLKFVKNRAIHLRRFKSNLQLTKAYLESQKEISSEVITYLTRKKY